jgi:hypothetical protein
LADSLPQANAAMLVIPHPAPPELQDKSQSGSDSELNGVLVISRDHYEAGRHKREKHEADQDAAAVAASLLLFEEETASKKPRNN